MNEKAKKEAKLMLGLDTIVEVTIRLLQSKKKKQIQVRS